MGFTQPSKLVPLWLLDNTKILGLGATMLIICNGIYKSGSTWVFLMLLELTGQGEPPKHWADPNQVRNIDVLKAPAEVLAAAETHDIISKIHSYERDFLLWLHEHDARCVVTRRDQVDILASHYHHFSKEKLRLPARLYAATIGFVKALEVVLYENIATAPDTADLVIDFARLKTNPAGVLAEIVHAFRLGYDADEIVAAAERANMRGRDYSETFAGMEERSWFFRREDSALHADDRRALVASVKWAQRLVGIRPLAQGLIWLFIRDPRRAKFRRFLARADGGTP
jgi:hypothetical protein